MPAGASEDFLFCAVETDSLLLLHMLIFRNKSMILCKIHQEYLLLLIFYISQYIYHAVGNLALLKIYCCMQQWKNF